MDIRYSGRSSVVHKYAHSVGISREEVVQLIGDMHWKVRGSGASLERARVGGWFGFGDRQSGREFRRK